MSEPWPIHTLVFDLDDTLFPESDFVLSGFNAVDRWLGETRGVRGFGEAAAKALAAGRRGKIFDEVLPLVGLEPASDLVAQAVEVYRAHVPKLALFPDAREILPWAAARFRLALVTDGYAAVQARKIKALGLESVIGCRVITDELGRQFWKPSPEPFRRVMAQCPGPAAGFVYVADNPRKDFIGARQVGWRTVRIRRASGEHVAYVASAAETAEIEISDLLELRSLLVPKKVEA